MPALRLRSASDAAHQDYQEYWRNRSSWRTYRISGTVQQEIENGAYEMKDTLLIERNGIKWVIR